MDKKIRGQLPEDFYPDGWFSQPDFYWMVGILDADGGFVKPSPSRPRSPRISVTMQDKDTIAKLSLLFQVSYYGFQPPGNRKRMYRLDLRGPRAVRIMNVIRPHMSERRRDQIDKLVSYFKPKKYAYGEKHPNSKLIKKDVLEIRARRKNGETLRQIAKDFDVTCGCVSNIALGKSWSWLDG